MKFNKQKQFKNLSIPGKPMTVSELNEQLDISRKSKSYTAKEAKAILGL
jgi:DNA-binding transcriptional regulator GbsR (MarR family)